MLRFHIKILLFQLITLLSYAQDQVAKENVEYAGNHSNWAFKTAFGIEAFRNPELAIRLEALMNGYRKAYSSEKIQNEIDQKLNAFHETLRKSAPGYKASMDATYSRDIGVGLTSDGIKSVKNVGLAFLAIDNPAGAVMLNSIAGSETFKRFQERATNEVFDWGYNLVDDTFFKTKNRALRENLIKRRQAELFFEENASEAHIAYWTNPQFRELWDVNFQNSMLNPSRSLEELEKNYPYLQIEKRTAEIRKQQEKNYSLLLSQSNESHKQAQQIALGVEHLIEEGEANKLKITEAKNNQDQLFIQGLRIKTLESGLGLLQTASHLIEDKESRFYADMALQAGHVALTIYNYEYTNQTIKAQQMSDTDMESAQSMNNASGMMNIYTAFFQIGFMYAEHEMARGEPTMGDVLSQIVKMIQDLSQMIEDRFDRVDNKLEKVLKGIEEIKLAIADGNHIDRKKLDIIRNELISTRSRLLGDNYKSVKTTKEILDENSRNAYVLSLRTADLSEKLNLSERVMVTLSQTASVYSLESQRTLLPENATEAQQRLDELTRRDISELGGVLVDQLNKDLGLKYSSQSASLNTFDWSKSSGMISQIVSKNAPALLKTEFCSHAKSDVESAEQVATEYIKTLTTLVRENPKLLSDYLNTYDKMMKDFLAELKKQGVTSPKDAPFILTADNSIEGLYKEAEKIPQPKWDHVRGYINWDTVSNGSQLPDLEKIPDKVWSLVSPKIKLYSVIGGSRALSVSYYVDDLRGQKPTKAYTTDGKELNIEKLANLKQPAWMNLNDSLHFARVFWVISAKMDERYHPIAVFYGDNVVFEKDTLAIPFFAGLTAAHNTGHMDFLQSIFKRVPFQEKALMDLIDYKVSGPDNHAFAPSEIFSTGDPNTALDVYRYTFSDSFYSADTPKPRSPEENASNSHRSYMNKYLHLDGIYALADSANWMMNARISELDKEMQGILKRQREKFLEDSKGKFSPQANLLGNSQLEIEVQLRLMTLNRLIEMLYPNMNESGIYAWYAVLNGPNRLYTPQELLELAQNEGLDLNSAQKIYESRLYTARKYFDELSQQNFVAPSYMYETLQALEMSRKVLSDLETSTR